MMATIAASNDGSSRSSTNRRVQPQVTFAQYPMMFSSRPGRRRADEGWITIRPGFRLQVEPTAWMHLGAKEPAVAFFLSRICPWNSEQNAPHHLLVS